MYAMHGKWNEQERNSDRGWITINKTLRIEWVFDWIWKDKFVLAIQPLHGWDLWLSSSMHCIHGYSYSIPSEL